MTESKTIWIVEDEDRIADVIGAYLTQSGFAVERFADGANLVARVKARPPDLILLDLMLPGADGMDLCREIRHFSQVPIIMVTAKVEEIDRLLGLELGADDYICKPFSPREVVARVKTVLRRSTAASPPPEPESPAKQTQSGGFAVDGDRFSATLDGIELGLTPKEFNLLAAFVDQPGRVFSRDQLMDKVYGSDIYLSDRTIDSHLKNLRKKIAAVRPGFDCIQAVYGVGYKFNPTPAPDK